MVTGDCSEAPAVKYGGHYEEEVHHTERKVLLPLVLLAEKAGEPSTGTEFLFALEQLHAELNDSHGRLVQGKLNHLDLRSPNRPIGLSKTSLLFFFCQEPCRCGRIPVHLLF